MAQYPIRVDISKKPTAPAKPRQSSALERETLDPGKAVARGNRIQRETKESRTMKKFAKGGSIDGCAQRGKTKAAQVKMASGGKCYAKGGAIDGVAKKGRTKAKVVKMAAGGATGAPMGAGRMMGMGRPGFAGMGRPDFAGAGRPPMPQGMADMMGRAMANVPQGAMDRTQGMMSRFGGRSMPPAGGRPMAKGGKTKKDC